MNRHSARYVAVFAAVSIGLGMSSPSASADDDNPPLGDETVYYGSEGPKNAYVVQATAEVMLNCMKNMGLAPTGATSEEVLGTVTNGVEAAPTGVALDPGDGCTVEAWFAVSNAIDMLTDKYQINTALEGLATQAKSGAVQYYVQTRFAGPGEDPSAARSTSTTQALPSRETRTFWINRRGVVNSYADFLSLRGTPSYLNWANNGCSAPLIGEGPYDFIGPCLRHDFNYRNTQDVGAWTRNNKAVGDTMFQVDLLTRCLQWNAVVRYSCYSFAGYYAYAVRAAGTYNTVGVETLTYRW